MHTHHESAELLHGRSREKHYSRDGPADAPGVVEIFCELRRSRIWVPRSSRLSLAKKDVYRVRCADQAGASAMDREVPERVVLAPGQLSDLPLAIPQVRMKRESLVVRHGTLAWHTATRGGNVARPPHRRLA